MDIRKCPDCGEELVDQLEEETYPDIEWVGLHPLPGTVYAEMVKEVLDQHHIPNLLIKDFLASAYGASGTSLAGNESLILVPKPFHQEAERILHEMVDHI
ncbi:MAG: hypothetical protein D6814_16820 [Calditrichaeota bacterium]|nr:MAG: hypothetical protein D6814_16820 [Calditrichota bacterium]